MVLARENRAVLRGTVREIRPRAGSSAVRDVVIHVDRAEDVEGFPNLLSETEGTETAVGVDAEALQALSVEPGTSVRCRAELRGPGAIMAEPGGLSRA